MKADLETVGRQGTSILPCVVALLFAAACAGRTPAEARAKIEKEFQKTFQAADHSRAAQLRVVSERLRIDVKAGMARDATAASDSADRPFHVASIGKVFTAVLVLQLAAEGKLKLSDHVVDHLPRDELAGLFVFEGRDWSDRVTIDQLLTHTSGAGDYFSSAPDQDTHEIDERSILREILNAPNRFWTPREILAFARQRTPAGARPGDRFFYSDTGYILLGLLIERVTGRSLEAALTERIFRPLGMRHTWMHRRSAPAVAPDLPLAPMMLGDTEVTEYASVSADWAGGGLVSTVDDLLRFQKALVAGRIPGVPGYAAMAGDHVFLDGIRYGRGLMTVRYGEMSVFMPNVPELFGHSGLLTTLLFYCPQYDLHIIANFGSTDEIAAGFEMMFWIVRAAGELHDSARP